MDNSASVSVVIVTYFAGPTLFKTLTNALGSPDVLEVILVNHGSAPDDDAALHQLQNQHQRLNIISGHGNIGFAAGCNLGALHATGEYLFFLNPDAIPSNQTTKMLVQECAQQPPPTIVGAHILNQDGSEQRGGRRGELTLTSAMIVMLRLGRFFKNNNHLKIHKEDEPLPDTPIDMPTISGAAFMIRASDYSQIGGMDRGYFFHVDDFDICKRVRDAGGVVRFHPHATVTHLGATSAVSSWFVEWHKGRSLVRYFLKHTPGLFGKFTALLLAPVIIGLSLARPAIRGFLSVKRTGL